MFENFTFQTIEANGIPIKCAHAGSGPPVLMLHGFPQNLAMWARIAPILAQTYTVVCADLRGYGDSGKPRCSADRSNYSFRTMAADQVDLMKQLGFERFHIIGHDRGGRTGHRTALDHPERVLSLSVLDIAPTYAMFVDTNRRIAGAYWHWYFLSQPEPFPEHMIGLDANTFYETCLLGWGATSLANFDREQLEDYRRCWRDPGMIHGSCSDYRAAASIDLDHDAADIGIKVTCPTLAFWGSKGVMHGLFDLAAEWRKRCTHVATASLPGGHFFPDQFPDETAERLLHFLKIGS